MYRKNNDTGRQGSSVDQVFTEVIAAVVFFMILFVIIQQLRFIEVFEKKRVETIQTYLKDQIEATFARQQLADRTPQISVEPTSPLIQRIIMNNNSLRFDSGEDDLQTTEDMRIVDLIGGILKQNQEVIEALQVEGHTDTVNINTREFPSNWELSSARAATVVHRMTEYAGFPPEKISSVGFSQYHPIDDRNIELNRRIEFIIRYNYDKEYTYSGRANEIYEELETLKK